MHDKQRSAPSSPSKVIKMLKGQKKHIDKEQDKTKHEAPGSVNNIGTTALERSVVYTTGRFKGLSLYKLRPGARYNS